MNKKHWYALVFKGWSTKGRTQYITASVYVSYDEPMITLSRLRQAKERAGVQSEAVLLAVNYLGYMSRSEFMQD